MHAFLISYVYVQQSRQMRWWRSQRSHQSRPSRRRGVRPRPKVQFTPVQSSSPKASPGACPIILNYDSLYICLFITCALCFRNCLEPQLHDRQVSLSLYQYVQVNSDAMLNRSRQKTSDFLSLARYRILQKSSNCRLLAGHVIAFILQYLRYGMQCGMMKT